MTRRMARRRARRRALATGLCVAAAYVLAVAGGSWLHIGAGAPLLDGTFPAPPYRWVSPPPALASANRPPEAQRFTITMGKRGSDPQVISTSDLQATIVLGPVAIPLHPGSATAQLEVTPLAPSAVGPLPAGLVVAGNVYHFVATYEGDGPVGPLRRPAPVTLSYPAIPIPTGRHVPHKFEWSADGHTWKVLATRDNAQGQLAEALVESFGYVAVGIPAGVADGLVPSPQAGASGSGSSGSKTLPILAVAGAVLLALLVVVVALRRRRYRGFHRHGT
jgi:hypothetical protein